jgi:hypothetical protein
MYNRINMLSSTMIMAVGLAMISPFSVSGQGLQRRLVTSTH